MNAVNYVITGAGIVACVVFIVGYWYVTRGGWFRDEAGRFLMSYAGTVLLLLLIVIVGPFPLRRALITITYLAFVLTLWWPLRLLWLAQREKRDDVP